MFQWSLTRKAVIGDDKTRVSQYMITAHIPRHFKFLIARSRRVISTLDVNLTGTLFLIRLFGSYILG